MSKSQKIRRPELDPSSSSSSDDDDMGYDANPPPLTSSKISPRTAAAQQPPIAHFKNFQRNTTSSSAAATAGAGGGESATGIEWGDGDDDDSDEIKSAATSPSARGGGGGGGPTQSSSKPMSSSKRNNNKGGGISGKFPVASTPPSSRQSQQSDRFAGGGRTITTTGSTRGGGRSMVSRRPSQRNLANQRKSAIGDDVIVLGDSSTLGFQHQGSGADGGGASTGDLASTRGGGSRRSNSGGSASKNHNGDDDPDNPLSGVNTLPWSRGKLVYKDNMGSFYVGVDRLSKSVMIGKEIPCDAIPNLPMRYTLLKDEVAKMTKLDHDNIVRYHGVDRIGDLLIVISDLVPGGRLLDLIKEHGRLDEKTASLYVYHILCGLDYLHSSGFTHCNMKSANVLVSASGVVKLSDYGSTLFLNSTGPTLHEGHEAARWSAPEVVRGEGTTASIDVWSVGCVTMELVFGEMPFEHLGSLFTVLMAVGNPELEMTLPTDYDLSPECTDFITKCLRKHPASRPKTSELLQHPFLSDAAARANTSSWGRGFSNRSMSTTAPSNASSNNACCDSAVGLEHSSSPSHTTTGTPGGGGASDTLGSGSLGSPAVSTNGVGLSHILQQQSSANTNTMNQQQQQPMSIEDQEIAMLQRGRQGGGPVCAHDVSIFSRFEDPLVARSHQVCMLTRAAFLVACSTSHAQRCANRVMYKCQKNRIAYLRRRRLNNKRYGSSTTAGNSGHSWPTRSDGITSDHEAGNSNNNTPMIMGASASPTPNHPHHHHGGSGTKSGAASPLSASGGSNSRSSFLPMLLGNSLRQHRQEEEAAAALSARTPQQQRIKKRLGSSLRGPRLPPDVREEEDQLEAASCVEIAILDLISQVELRRVSLFNRDGRPGFALSNHVSPPLWWPTEMSSSFRHNRSSSSKHQPHPHPSSQQRPTSRGGGGGKNGAKSNRGSQHHVEHQQSITTTTGQSSSSPHTTAITIPSNQQGTQQGDVAGVGGASITADSSNNNNGGASTTSNPNANDDGQDNYLGGSSLEGSRQGTADGSIADLVDIRTDDGSIDENPQWRRQNTPGDGGGGAGGGGGEPLGHVASAGSITAGDGGDTAATADNGGGRRSPFSPSLRQKGVGGSGSYDASAAGGGVGPPFSSSSSPRHNHGSHNYNGHHSTSTAARYYFLNPKIPLEVYVPQELILKLGDESSLHHFLPPVDEGGLSVRTGMVLVGVMTAVFLVWTIVTLIIVLVY